MLCVAGMTWISACTASSRTQAFFLGRADATLRKLKDVKARRMGRGAPGGEKVNVALTHS